MKYFIGITDLVELRKLYYKLALQFHPDRGGSDEIMKAINNEYENVSARLINGFSDYSEDRKSYEFSVSEEIVLKINEILHLNNVKIEIIGGWIWITGNTFPLKDELKELQFKFSRNKTAWYWHSEGYRKRSKKAFSLDEIRDFFGYQEVESKNDKSYILN